MEAILDVTLCIKLVFFRRGRGRTQMSFLPRSLQVSSNTSSTSLSATTSDTTKTTSHTVTSNGSSSKNETNGESGGSGDAKKAMSNADFRQLMFAKK